MQNNFVSPFFNANVGVRQESVLSPILSTFYITPIFHIFEKRSKNLFHNFSISFLSFVNDSLFILQEKYFKKSNAFLFVATTLFHLYLISSDLQLNMESQKFSIFLDQPKTSASLLWIYLPEGDLFYNQGITGNILDSFLIGNFPFNNIFTFISTRLFQ